jgi:glucose/mannose transport system substrate-binding protein
MKRILSLALCAMVLVAAQTVGAQAKKDANVLEIWHIWTAGGEAEAFKALTDGFQAAHPEIKLQLRPMAGSSDLRQQLGIALMGGSPPEVFYTPGPATLLKDFADAGSIAPITDVWTSAKCEQNYDPAIVSMYKIRADYWAMPLNIHSENAVWYNVDVFNKLGLKPPKTWDDYKKICDTLKKNGIAPTVGTTGWPIPMTIEPFIVKAAGTKGWNDFLNGKLSFTGPEMRQAFKDWKELYLDQLIKDWAGYAWADAAKPFIEGKAGMYFSHGDWLESLFKSQGMDDSKFGFFFAPAPDAGSAPIIIVDSFALAKGCANPKLGKMFLEYCASVDGQKRFNKIKGSIAPNKQVPADIYDATMSKMNAMYKQKDTKILMDNGYIFHREFEDKWETLLGQYALTPTPEVLENALNELESLRKTTEFVEWK